MSLESGFSGLCSWGIQNRSAVSQFRECLLRLLPRSSPQPIFGSLLPTTALGRGTDDGGRDTVFAQHDVVVVAISDAKSLGELRLCRYGLRIRVGRRSLPRASRCTAAHLASQMQKKKCHATNNSAGQNNSRFGQRSRTIARAAQINMRVPSRT